jgi:hypothetical protein
MLVVDAKRRMTKKYFWHSDVMDFFYFDDTDMAHAADFDSGRMDEIAELIEEHLSSSNAIERARRRPQATTADPADPGCSGN